MRSALAESIDLRSETELTVQTLLCAIDNLERLARLSPSVVRSTGYYLIEAHDRLASREGGLPMISMPRGPYRPPGRGSWTLDYKPTAFERMRHRRFRRALIIVLGACAWTLAIGALLFEHLS